MRAERTAEVRAAWERFQQARDQEWAHQYLTAVSRAAEASEAEFRAEAFQRQLWESDEVCTVGFGSSVTVVGAYADREVVDRLWALREWRVPDDVLERARLLSASFDEIIGLVTPRHNKRHPWARLVRVFATLRPHEALCLIDDNRTWLFRQWLEQPNYKLRVVGQHVVCRHALAEVLGPAASVDEAIARSQFSWFAWEQVIHPREAPGEPLDVAPPKATDIPSLSVRPAQAQRKGLSYVTNNLELLHGIVQAAENGIDRESLERQVAEDAPALNRSSRLNMISQATSVGLVSFENGTYRPTANGRALLDGEPASQILTPILIRTVFGVAQILDDVGRAGVLTRGEIAEKCRQYYPRWTTNWAPNALVSWLRELDLIAIEGSGEAARISLSESGEHWRSGLPADIKAPQFLLTDAVPEPPAPERPEAAAFDVPKRAPFAPPGVESVVAAFRQDSLLVFDDNQVRRLHAALHAVEGKRFVLLAGLSGTGKTSIARAYAHAYCAVLGLDPKVFYAQVAVWPDWTDPTGLLGYVNPLANPPLFQETPALSLVLDATANPDKPYFLCLDEMNLARVEHYFAPFLSAMEGGGGSLALHSGGEQVDRVPPKIPWPRNLFILGTVNMDETTHPFSDKVLDRAFTFEFWTVDLPAWRAKALERGTDGATLDRIFPVLTELSEALKPARRHFGYRTCDEIAGFITEGGPGLLDFAVLAKILPKVRGDSDGPLPKAIETAIEVCERHGLTESAAKLAQMQQTLVALGAVRFWS